jgi:hypothetical protein
MTNKADQSQSPKMTSLKAMFASGQPIAEGSVFHDGELESHGTVIEKGFHAVGAPLSRWRLVASAFCITGEVHRAGGAAAQDSDTNFELVIPGLDGNGQLGDQAKTLNAKIDEVNQAENKAFAHIENAEPNKLDDARSRIGIHCEVDKNRLADLKPDLAGMMIGDCYEICGQLVLDTWHGGLYEIHPVQTVNRC